MSTGAQVGPPHPHSVDVETEYDTSLNVKDRFNVYKWAENPIDMYDEAFRRLTLGGSETVVDVGCNNGENLRKLQLERKHQGSLIGVDINPSVLDEATLIAQAEKAQIDFKPGDAASLSLEDDSADVLYAMFMLYHVNTPEAGLAEFKRVVKAGGKIAIATSGPLNKAKHRQTEQDMALYLGMDPPPIFSEPFNSVVAKEMLPEFFDHYDVVPHISRLIIKPGRRLQDYIRSLGSMRKSFHPRLESDKEWQAAVNAVLMPMVALEMRDNNFYSDPVERYLYVCTNDK